MRRRTLLALCAGVAAAGVPVAAGADETRASADVSAGVGWSNNPFGGPGGGGSTYGQVGVSPQLSITNERRTILLSGSLFYQKYFKSYSDTTTYQADADYSERVSPSTSVHARLGYTSARLGTFGFGGLPGTIGGTLDPVVGAPGAPATGVGATAPLLNPTLGTVLLPGAEVGAFGAGQRQYTLSAAGDVSTALSERNSVTANVYYLRSRYGDTPDRLLFGSLGDYDAYGTTLGLNRRLSERTTLGLQASVSAYNYSFSPGLIAPPTLGGGQSDSRVYSLQGTFSRQLNEFWTLDASLGASYLDQETGGHDVTASGTANLCRRGERSNTCIQLARSLQPTGFAGTRTQTSAGLSWALQLGQYDNLSLAASYVNVSGGTTPLDSLTPLGSLDDQYALATVAYSRPVGRRLRLSPSIYYRKIFGGQTNRNDDYGGQVSLSFRLGDLR